MAIHATTSNPPPVFGLASTSLLQLGSASSLMPCCGSSSSSTEPQAAAGMTSLYGKLRSLHPAPAVPAAQQQQHGAATDGCRSDTHSTASSVTAGQKPKQQAASISSSSDTSSIRSLPLQTNSSAAGAPPLTQYSLFSNFNTSSSAGCRTSRSSSYSTASSIYAGDQGSFSGSHQAPVAAADAVAAPSTGVPATAAHAAAAESSAVLLEALGGLSAAAVTAGGATLLSAHSTPAAPAHPPGIDFGSLVAQLQQLYVSEAAAAPASGGSSSCATAPAAAASPAPGGFDFVQQQLLTQQLRELQESQLLRAASTNPASAAALFNGFDFSAAAAAAAAVPAASLNLHSALFVDHQQQHQQQPQLGSGGAGAAGGVHASTHFQQAAALQLPAGLAPQFPTADAMHPSLLSMQQQHQQQQLALAQLMAQLGPHAASSSNLAGFDTSLSPSPFSTTTYAASMAATDMPVATSLPGTGVPTSVAVALAALQNKMVLGPHMLGSAGSGAMGGGMAAAGLAAAAAAAAAANGCMLGGMADGKQILQLGPGNNPMYKTELCRTWQETGGCRYGSRCQFAHGPKELRPVLRHPKYKTQPCRTFSIQGSCPYGDRCNFIHDKALKASGNRLLPTQASDSSSSGCGAADGSCGCGSGMELALSLWACC